LEVDDRTIERYLASNGEELKQNGYRFLKGKALKDFKKLHVSDIYVGDMLIRSGHYMGVSAMPR
jgi:hypothetical protein